MLLAHCGLLLATLTTATAAASGSVPLNAWEWALDQDGTPPADHWVASERPSATVEARDEVTVWFRTILPLLASDETPTILLGRHFGSVEVRVEGQSVETFGATRDRPWRVVALPADAAGKRLYLRLRQAPSHAGRVTIIGGVRFGTSASHYLWMLREEWTTAALAIGLFVLSALLAVAYAVSRTLRRPQSFGPLSVMCASSAAFLVPAGAPHLAAIFVPHGLLDFVDIIAASIALIAQAYYLRALYGTTRFGLRPLVWLSFLYSLVVAIGGYSGGFELVSSGEIFAALDAGTSLVVVANVVAAWRGASRGIRVASIGLLLSELFTLYELITTALHLGSPIGSPGFWPALAYVSFIVLSFVVVNVEQRAAIEQEKARNAKARAVAETTTMFAHDVRKPFAVLEAVLGVLERAQTMEELSSTLGPVAKEIRATRQGVDEMIEGILEAGQNAPLRLEDEELENLLGTVWTQVSRTTDTQGLVLQRSLLHSHQLRVQRSQINRALSNIVFNALEAMNGSGRLWFDAKDVLVSGQQMVEVTIGNSGSFIEPERLGRLFEPFVTSGKPRGTGLGLWIAKQAVEVHGGSIRCASTIERGVEFVLTLPASTARRGPVAPWPSFESASQPRPLQETAPADAEPQPAPPGGRHVILVEDSAGIRLAWRSRHPGLLRDFESPAHLLAEVERQPSLLSEALYVILDHQFQRGQIDGIELGELLHRQTKAPILLCSGVPVESPPTWCRAQLPKETFGLDELARAASGQ